MSVRVITFPFILYVISTHRIPAFVRKRMDGKVQDISNGLRDKVIPPHDSGDSASIWFHPRNLTPVGWNGERRHGHRHFMEACLRKLLARYALWKNI